MQLWRGLVACAIFYMNSTKRIRNQRKRLYIQFEGKCENCGILTVLPEDLPKRPRKEGGAHTELLVVPPNMATIQHKYDKLHPLRNITDRRERRHFLWCYQCNREYQNLYENERALLNSNKNENKL